MLKPGTLIGPMRLPVSYTKDQLDIYGWSEEKGKFCKPSKGAWASKLHHGQWGPQGPRATRKPSHYWKTREVSSGHVELGELQGNCKSKEGRRN